MLNIQIELRPHGTELGKRLLGEIQIANVGKTEDTFSDKLYDYSCAAFYLPYNSDKQGVVVQHVPITAWNRIDNDAIDLLHAVLGKIIEERKAHG